MPNRSCLAALVLVPALAGCGSTAYRPHASPRLQVVSDGGGLALARDGETFSLGMFGSGLEDAVKGNARAEKEASSFQSKTVGGFVVGMLGSLASAGGAALLVGNELSQHPSSGARVGAISLAVGGVVATLVAALLQSSAKPHMWNAINMYNDDLPPPWGFGQGQYGRPGPGYGAPAGGYGQPPYGAPQMWAPPSAPMPHVPAPAAPAPMPNAPAPLPNAPSPVPNAPPPNAPAPIPGAPAPIPGAPAPTP
ncbi:MAG: hypothetical protein QM820_21845 [Minicystis sp.]